MPETLPDDRLITRDADVVVLCYHAVGEAASLPSVWPQQLEQQLQRLQGQGYAPELASNVARLQSHRRVAVTFDDGYRSVLEKGAPVLRRLGVPATVFVVTDWVGHTVGAGDSPALTWDDLHALAREGWEIGSHTVSHPRLTALTSRELRKELEKSKATIEAELGRPCVSFAYPWGLVDERVEREVQTAGYEVAFSVSRRMFRPLIYRWPRVTVFASDGGLAFALKTSWEGRLLRRTRVGAAVAALVAAASFRRR